MKKELRDNENPIYMFGQTSVKLLKDIANEEFDTVFYARCEMANRGLGKNGEWVGFKEAQKIWDIYL